MAIQNVEMDEAFLGGSRDNQEFKDWPRLSAEERERVKRFIRAVLKEDLLPGRNKESWLDSTNTPIPGTEDYRRLNIWHYHCGPFAASATGAYFTHNLQRNLRGETSAAVIHYRKVDDDTIIILAFSPNHIPFPQLDLNETP